MGKKKMLYNLRGNISDNAVRIQYLLQNALYKSDSERETVIFGAMALELAGQIKKCSEKIGRILKH